jgi:hypothetical protein
MEVYMRISILKESGKLIEMQSHARPGTLTENAVLSGYSRECVEEREITPEEWKEYARQIQEDNANTDQLIKQRLEKIDKQSIRSLREWVSKQPDAPAILIAHEAEATAEREKLKDNGKIGK